MANAAPTTVAPAAVEVDHSAHAQATAGNGNEPQVFEVEPAEVFVAEGHGETVAHPQPELLGLQPFQWVSISMAVLLLIAFVGLKVHKTIAGGLDNKIAEIRRNLDEAKALRTEAETLRAEYAAKIADAENDAAAMIDNARTEADAIVGKAETDAAAMIVRREQMAQDKIGAAERQAVADLRARAASASTAAAAALIADRHDAAADAAMADQVIAAI
jgi:F-type H+-transporting ATPase subunit b